MMTAPMPRHRLSIPVLFIACTAALTLVVLSSNSQAATIDDLVGKWKGITGSTLEIRKEGNRGAAYITELSDDARTRGFTVDEKVVDDIQVRGRRVRFSIKYRAQGCPEARANFRGTLSADEFTISGKSDFGRFEKDGSNPCRYQRGDRMKDLARSYVREGQPGPLRFVARTFDDEGRPSGFATISNITFGQTFYVEGQLGNWTGPAHVFVASPMEGFRVQLRRVPDQDGLYRSQAITLVPPEPR